MCGSYNFTLEISVFHSQDPEGSEEDTHCLTLRQTLGLIKDSLSLMLSDSNALNERGRALFIHL
jgi:hypothetical protein